MDRLSNGTFARGNRGGPGRPKRPVEAEYLTALTKAVPMPAWRKICRRAVQDAQNGDSKARDWLSRYLIDGGLAARVARLEELLQVEGGPHEPVDGPRRAS